MSATDEQFARKLTALLDQAAGDIPPGIAYRLQQARARALDGEPAADVAPSMAHALAGGIGTRPGFRQAGRGRSPWVQWRLWLGVAIIAAAAWGALQWSNYRQAKIYEELDAQILPSDLPIDAYLDQVSDAWLKTSAAGN